MRINWIYSATYNPEPEVDIESIKQTGPSWGSWRSWRACNTDNVICHNRPKAIDLVDREFYKNCNFYIPRKHFQEIGRPLGVKFYDGDFLELVDDLEDIVAMHLVASKSDIVLLAGFDLSTQNTPQDRFVQHRLKNRLGLMRSAFVNNPEIQWVLVDHPKEVDKAFSDLSNLTCDVMKNVLNLLK